MTHDGPFVVVGCDGSVASDPALRFAAEEARLRGTALVIVVAYDRPMDPDVDEFDVSDEELQTRARDAATTNVRRALDPESGQSPDYEIVAAEGAPAQVLRDHADGAVMIVIGSHDRPMLQRMFGRATSRGLLHDTDVPVTIVPSPSDDGRGTGTR